MREIRHAVIRDIPLLQFIEFSWKGHAGKLEFIL